MAFVFSLFIYNIKEVCRHLTRRADLVALASLTTASLTIGDADGATSGELGFFTPDNPITTIAANKAFIANNGTLQSVALKFGGATTGIGNAIGTTAEDNAPVYDLSGRRVAQPAKGGVYIKGGRKFIVK